MKTPFIKISVALQKEIRELKSENKMLRKRIDTERNLHFGMYNALKVKYRKILDDLQALVV